MTDALRIIDLHGKNEYQARIAINAALKNTAFVYRIRLIHGYHNGTALKEMIVREYSAHPKIRRIDQAGGPGRTDLVLREL